MVELFYRRSKEGRGLKIENSSLEINFNAKIEQSFKAKNYIKKINESSEFVLSELNINYKIIKTNLIVEIF